MKRLAILIFIQSFVFQMFAQIEKKDSIYFEGKYYKPEEYKNYKKEYDKYNFDERFCLA